MSTYDVITARIVQQLEAGTFPWRKPWGGKRHWPRNLVSGHHYRGINVFLLACSPYSAPYWLTFKQAEEWGGHVRKAERGSPVVFWTKLEKIDKDTGATVEIPLMRYYTVFNVAQCELPERRIPIVDTSADRPFSPIAACESVVDGMQNRPTIRHGFDGASYVPSFDEVRMPDGARFTSSEGYYATLFHELGHATSHQSRLNRKGITESAAFGSDTYGREELVAEMAAAFLSGHCDIEPAILENSASYIAGWLRAIRQDARLVVTAAAQAQKATDYILGKTWESETTETESVNELVGA
jgi:antirestriction protein ArdC